MAEEKKGVVGVVNETTRENKGLKKEKRYPPTSVIVFRCIFWLSILGLIIPFSAEVILPFLFPCIRVDGVAVWNQFVSIILGVIATIMSIVSLALCFRSDKNMTEAYNRIEVRLAGVDGHLNTIDKTQDVLKNLIYNAVNISQGNNGPIGPIPTGGGQQESQEEPL